MRLGFLVFVLTACSASASAKPAWPKATPREVDGGESLAPRAAARAVAAVAEDDRPVERSADKPAAAAAPLPAAPAAAAPVSATIEEVIMTEEIVIEIDD